MKHIVRYSLIVSFLFLQIVVSAQRGLQADIRPFIFNTPDDEPYVELYIGLLTESLRSNVYTGFKSVEVLQIIRRDSQVVFADKYQLQSTNTQKDFYHIQRSGLAPGDYEIQVTMRDLSDSTNTLHRLMEVSIPVPTPKPSFSSIQMLAHVEQDDGSRRMAKNGLVIEPLKFNYLNNKYKQLQAYVECYHTDLVSDQYYILKYDVIRESAGQLDTLLTRYKRRKAVAIDPILIREQNDTSWESGKYRLAIQALNYEKEVFARAGTDFVLSNPAVDAKSKDDQQTIDNSFVQKLTDEEMVYALKALAPKINPLDVERLNYLVEEGDLESKRSFLYRYWVYASPLDPQHGYEEYMKVAQALDNMYYDGLGHGFESDRGYIYLKYGRPDHKISIEDEHTAPPYEIWTYAYFPATKQNNVKFVFYNPASTTYELLHSNARGEVNDPQWLLKLYRNSPEDVIGNPVDANSVQDQWNRRAAEYFNDN